MLDFNDADKQTQAATKRPQVDPVSGFETELTRAGYKPGPIIADGEIKRFDLEKRGDKAGWYWLALDGTPAGGYGDWKSGKSEKWTAVTFSQLSPADQAEAARKFEAAKLKREAANALHRFKLRLEREGFYSGRVALNVWRSTALDAGTFDPEQYNDFKRQLYQKSIDDSMKCFEEYILEESYYDANICLQTWRMHAKELGAYEQAEYDALKKRLTEARRVKASKAKTTEKN